MTNKLQWILRDMAKKEALDLEDSVVDAFLGESVQVAVNEII